MKNLNKKQLELTLLELELSQSLMILAIDLCEDPKKDQNIIDETNAQILNTSRLIDGLNELIHKLELEDEEDELYNNRAVQEINLNKCACITKSNPIYVSVDKTNCKLHGLEF